MDFPIEVKSKLINPGTINDQYSYCISFTYFQGEQIIAYGSKNKVVIITNYLTIIDSLCEHKENSYVTAVAWTPYSGRLSSCGTDLKLHIWEPVKNGWSHIKEISLINEVNCLSWNYLGTKFCIASKKDFSIYNYPPIYKTENEIQPIFTEQTTTNYCAFSRDSRFILTLQKNNQVYIWYRSSTSTTEYRRLILTHPTQVTSISWRLSEDFYERCSFMSITKDGVARIWIETCVMERLSFHVAISIPAQQISAGCFIMTTSKMINERSSSLKTDKFANGNGHYQTRDKNSRYSSVPDPREIERNKSWVLCFHKDMKISMWELSGLSLSVRSTPKLRRLMLIDQTSPQFLKLERSFLPKLSYAIATSSKQYRLTDINAPSKVNEYITSLIFEDQRSHTLFSADIVKNKSYSFSINGILKGHRSEIKLFKFHNSMPFMISIDEEGTASFWKIDDSDVYDPKLLIQFKFTIGYNVQTADFVTNSDQIIGCDGRSIFLVKYDTDDGVPGDINRLHSNFHSEGKIIDLTVLNSENSMHGDRILFVALFSDVFYICSLDDNKVSIMFHKNSEEGDRFVTGMLGYLTMITRNTTKFIYRIATKKKIISIKLVLNDYGEEKPIIYYKIFGIEFKDEDEEIVCMKNSRPATVCIVTSKNNLYMGRQLMSKTRQIEILERIYLGDKANPNVISCLPNGFVAVAYEKEIQLYFTGRKSHEFTQSLLSLNCISRYKEIKKSPSALEWMANGILIYSEQGQIFALTKFMNTFFMDSNIKLPTIHHSLVNLTFSVPDLHSTVISPLAISGRLNLVSKMLKYYDQHFYEDDCKTVLKKYILNMPKETDKEGKHLCSKKLGESIKSLIEKIKEENKKIDGKEEKKLILNFDSKTENNRLLFIINKIKLIYDISFDILDKRALVFYRSYILSEKAHTPFDLICCALMSHEREKLYNLMNFQSWDAVERCGAVYWSDLNKLKETLVTIAIRDFNVTQHLSIFFLVLFKRFRALNHLYSTAGDEARASFFIRDFKTDKNKKSVLNNAFSALSKHSFHISAAMFILAGKYETALSVCNTNIHDHSLSYLLTCFSDDKKLRLSFLENVLIKEAKEKNDLAAIPLFEYLAYGKEIDLTLRMRQMQPGFLYNDMRIYGDVRFCVCEVLKPTIETVRELSRSLLLAGHFFLAAQFIMYLNQNIMHDDEINEIDSTSNLPIINDILSSREFDSEIVINIPKSRKENKLKRKFPSSISFQVLHNVQFENDDDENGTEIKSDKKVNDIKKESYSENESEEEEENNENDSILKKNIKHKHSKSKKYEYGIDSILGYSNYLDDIDFDYEEDSFSSSDVIDEMNDASDSDVESEFIDNLKDSFSQSLVRSKTMDNLTVRSSNLQNKNKKDIIEESTEINLSESLKTDSDFNTRFVLFNIARLRLETFLEQSLNLKEIQEIIPSLGKEIENFDGRINSIHPPLHDFLIKSCKRCSFVYRRILLLSDQKLQDYIASLCHSLANLPNLITSTYLTSQQIAQISHTIFCLTTYYNEKLNDQSFLDMRFILASIFTGFFVVGCYNMNADLLLTLLEQRMSSRTKYKFPQVLIDQIKVEIAVPENISIQAKKFEPDIDSANFISKMKENSFSYHDIDQNELFQFMWKLFDMMLIDEFSLMIEQIHVDQFKYQQFFIAIRKMKNLSMQLFIYAILNYPVILQIDSLDEVEIKNQSVEKLYKYLLKRNERESKIFNFCKEVYSQNSDIKPFHMTNVPEKTKLKNRKKVAHFKSGITSFCMSKDTIWAATPQGMKNCSTQDVENDANEGNENNENEELNVQFDDDIIEDSSIIMSDETLYSTTSISIENLSLRASDTCPSFLHKNRFSKKPYMLVSHPTEDYMLVSDYGGNIYARKYEDTNDSKISVFHTKYKSKCTAIGFQTTGTMFAAAQSNYVSLFSFCRDSYNKPYVTYNTYGSSVQNLAFVQGTGIFATCQKPSADFDASIVFWDSIMPPGTSMISSMKLEKIGKPLSICFSPKYKSVIVGTNKGSLVLIDTRKYEILKILKNAHEKNIRALTIDQNESYCVTGGGEGTVKVWDMRSLNNIGEMKNVHSPKTVKTGQKWKSYAITDIHIKNDIIYTSGLDGNIKRIEFT